MKRKFVAAVILFCFLSLGIGIVIGMGMGQNNLFGTAFDSSIQVRDGFFLVDGQKVDKEKLMMALNLETIMEDDKQISDQMNAIKERDDSLKKANEILAKMREAKSECEVIEMDEEIYNFCITYGIKVVGTKGEKLTKEQWDSNIETLKGYIDGLTSESQLEMIRLQSLMDKRNQAFEQASNTLQKDQENRDNIVRNTR